MSSDMPDWLAGLVAAEDDDYSPAAIAEPQASVAQSPLAAAPLQDATPQADVFEEEDVMADLRSQVVADEPVVAPVVRRRRSRYIFGLLPWQLFFLSVLMFLDVVVVGMIFLVILGRIVLPY